MKARIDRIINWKGKDYAHVVEDTLTEFCSLCSFQDVCEKVVSHEVPVDESPMKICQNISDELNINTAFFMDAVEAEGYVQRVNKIDKKL